MLTKEQIKQALPPSLQHNATQEFADRVNNLTQDPDLAESFRNNFISYTSVLNDGRFKTEAYLNAITYVSFKLMDMSNQDAWARTFPAKYNNLVGQGLSSKQISSYVAGYAKGQLVNSILEQTLVPTWVLNQDIFQQAINTQASIMNDVSASQKTRVEAANSILTHLKRPETKKVELDLGVRENQGMNDLRDMLNDMAKTQQDLIAQGVTTKTIAHQPLGRPLPVIEGEAKDVTPQHPEA